MTKVSYGNLSIPYYFNPILHDIIEDYKVRHEIPEEALCHVKATTTQIHLRYYIHPTYRKDFGFPVAWIIEQLEDVAPARALYAARTWGI